MKPQTLAIFIIGIISISVSIYLGFTYEKSTFMKSCKIEMAKQFANSKLKANKQDVEWTCETMYINNGKLN